MPTPALEGFNNIVVQCKKFTRLTGGQSLTAPRQSTKSFRLFHWEKGNTAMEQPIRELTVDEVESVAGGDSHLGEGMCTAPQLWVQVANTKITIIRGTDLCDYL